MKLKILNGHECPEMKLKENRNRKNFNMSLNTVHHHGVQPSDHPCKLGLALQVPVLLPPDTSCQLDISGLDCDPLGIDGQKVGILHNGDQVVLSCLVKGFDGVSLPSQWALVALTPFISPI